MSSRNWCYTLNNPTNGDEITVQNFTCKYNVFGREKGANGTPHLQGYVEWNSAKTLEQLKKYNAKIHWEKRRGTQEQAVTYCKKDGNFWENKPFEPNEPGKRTDIEIVKEAIKNGNSMGQIIELTNSYQALRCAELLFKYIEGEREKPMVMWHWGKPGTGKTFTARRLAREHGHIPYMSMGNLKWWDGYDNHQWVIIDDLRPGDIQFNYLLRLLDEYPLRVEVKGGSRNFVAKYITVTSCLHPKDFVPANENPAQLIRRIDEIQEFTEVHSVGVVSTTTTEV